MEALRQRFAADLDFSKRQRAGLTGDFDHAKQAIEREMCEVKKRFDSTALTMANVHRSQLQKLKERFPQKRNQLLEQMQSVKIEIRNAEERNAQGVRDENEGHQLAIARYKRKCRDELMKLRSESEAILAFLAERIEVLTLTRDTMRCKFDNKEGRPCDIDMIRKLVEHLKAVKTLLAAKVKDLLQYRSLFVGQDQTYNSKFGKNPNVAVLRFC
jgi:hypothetical protein